MFSTRTHVSAKQENDVQRKKHQRSIISFSFSLFCSKNNNRYWKTTHCCLITPINFLFRVTHSPSLSLHLTLIHYYISFIVYELFKFLHVLATRVTLLAFQQQLQAYSMEKLYPVRMRIDPIFEKKVPLIFFTKWFSLSKK